MNAIQLLIKDHNRVKELFTAFEKAGLRAYQEKRDLFDAIQDELEMHSQVEEEIFYPAIMQIQFGQTKAMVREAREEHHIVKDLLRELSLMQPEEDQYDAKITVVKENVERHVKEEEDEMFDKAKRHLSVNHLEELGKEMEALKEGFKKQAA